MAKSTGAESAQKLTWKEATHLVHKLYADGKFKYSAFVATSIYLGLRYSDTSRITWHEIISLQPGEEFSTIETKTGKEARRPLVSELLDHVAKCYHSLGSKVSHYQPIIKTNSKTIVKAASLQAMNKIAKNWHDLYDIRGARKTNFSMHSFRKTAAWKYYTATGNNLIATMNFLNHSSPDVTKRYLRLDQQEMHDNYLKAFGTRSEDIPVEAETIKGVKETPKPKA